MYIKEFKVSTRKDNQLSLRFGTPVDSLKKYKNCSLVELGTTGEEVGSIALKLEINKEVDRDTKLLLNLFSFWNKLGFIVKLNVEPDADLDKQFSDVVKGFKKRTRGLYERDKRNKSVRRLVDSGNMSIWQAFNKYKYFLYSGYGSVVEIIAFNLKEMTNEDKENCFVVLKDDTSISVSEIISDIAIICDERRNNIIYEDSLFDDMLVILGKDKLIFIDTVFREVNKNDSGYRIKCNTLFKLVDRLMAGDKFNE